MTKKRAIWFRRRFLIGLQVESFEGFVLTTLGAIGVAGSWVTADWMDGKGYDPAMSGLLLLAGAVVFVAVWATALVHSAPDNYKHRRE